MIPKNTRAILFDMDGTLTDTEQEGIHTLDIICSKFKINLSAEEADLFDKVWRRDGTDIEFEDYLHQILQKHGNSLNEKTVLQDFFDTYENCILKAPLLPGVDKFLRKVKLKYKLALVTASTNEQANAIIHFQNWNNIFNLVLTQDVYKIKKPSPVPYLMAAQKLMVKPKDCLVIEDAKNGVLSGINAGMFVIGVKAGNKHLQDISMADEIVDTFQNIKIE